MCLSQLKLRANRVVPFHHHIPKNFTLKMCALVT